MKVSKEEFQKFLEGKDLKIDYSQICDPPQTMYYENGKLIANEVHNYSFKDTVIKNEDITYYIR